MAKSLLTKNQNNFLDFVKRQPELYGKFYFSGGTALSEFYLQHRYSEDLDFFSEEEFDAAALSVFLLSRKKNFHAQSIQYRQSFNRNLFFLDFEDRASLKVEFTYYPFARLEKGLLIDNLQVDSVLDIAVNKVFILTQQARGRDYFDLFEIHLKYDFDFKRLVTLARGKFDFPIDYVQLGKSLVGVSKFLDDPILSRETDRDAMQNYFLRLAGELDIVSE